MNDMRRPGFLTEGVFQLGQSKHSSLQFYSASLCWIPIQTTQQPLLWLDNWYNLPWVQEELRNRISMKAEEPCAVQKRQQDCIILLNSVKACGRKKDLSQGSRLHAYALEKGLLNHDIYVRTALLRMYSKCGALAKAQEVFDELPLRDAVSWTALITGYAEHGLSEEALNCFGQMQDEGVSPDACTFVCVLKACGRLGATQKGEEIHAEVCRLGLLDNNDTVLRTALVDMYSKCGVLAKAQEVFDELSIRDEVSWTALITGYAQHGFGEEALNCFGWMRDDGFSPDMVTYICILKACGSIGATEKGEEIHAKIRKQGLLKNHNIVLANALVDMYAKCGALAKAQEVFDELLERNVVTWTTLIAGYAQHGRGDDAMNCFERMQDEGFSPNAITFLCILKACGSIGAIRKGEEIHAEVCRRGLLESHANLLGTPLVDMYAKCGALAKAQKVFNELPVRNVASWNAVIAGYTRVGKATRVFELFNKMRGEHTEPDGITFIVLLTACSHAGLIEEGKMLYDIMSTVYCIIPTLEHHTCMVDLYSHAGHFDKAMSVMVRLSDSDLLLALLGASRKGVNLELGEWAFEHALQLDDKCAAAYACMSNIYQPTRRSRQNKSFENKKWSMHR